MRVLFDTDIVLDLLLARAGFVDEAAALFAAHDRDEIGAFISAITPLNVFYIASKALGKQTTREAVYELLAAIDICPANQQVLQAALNLPLKDYEDAVQVAGAVALRLDALITRNLRDYQNSPLPIYSPADFLALLAAKEQ